MLDGGWLFPGLNPVDPLSTRQLNRAVREAADAARIDKHVSMHTLRHYPEFRNMPSEVGGARAGGARGRNAQVRRSAYSMASERIEKRKQLVAGAKAAGPPRSRINFVQCRLLHLEIGIEIDLCRLD